MPRIFIGPMGIFTGLLLAGRLLMPAAGQSPATPDLAFIPYTKYAAWDFKPVPAVLKRIAQARLKMSSTESRRLLQQLFDDRIPALDYISAALNLGVEVTPAQRQELIAREKGVDRDPADTAEICGRIADLNVQKNELEGYPSFTEGLYRFSVLGLEAPSGRADLILIPRMYFGPSPGLRFFGREGDHFVYLGEHSGDIRRIDEDRTAIVLRFMVNILDPSETGIVFNFRFDRRGRSWTITKQYYAQQTEIPVRLSAATASQTVRESELRTGPHVDDGLPRTDHDQDVVTTTLKGNIVARFPEGAACLVLAAKGEWAFVAFTPASAPRESSLYHDLDHTLEQTRKELGVSPLRPYLCGWIRREALEPRR
jgi:hypothetical protein